MALAWLYGPIAPVPEFMPICCRIGPLTTTIAAAELLVLPRALICVAARARMTGKYAGRAPAINALTATIEVIIPVQAEYYALEGLSQLTNVMRRVQDALNPQLHVTGVLVTMFDGRTKLAMEVLEELNAYFPRQMFKTQIPRNVRLSEAPSFGKPVILFDVKSRGAQAYMSLAKEMLEQHVPTSSGVSS